MADLEIDVDLASLPAWHALRASRPWVADPASARKIAETALCDGIESPHFGAIAPAEIRVAGPNLRENFLARGLNARQRAVLECLEARCGTTQRDALRIYAPEAVTPFARYMARTFPVYVGSEYLPDAAKRARFPGVAHQDLAALELPEARFDAVLCNEVFEHLPALDRALAELARITRPGGWLISTFPFAYEREVGVVKARLDGDRITHLDTPEYHDDPVADARSALVFEIPGWDILRRVEAAGFGTARMRFVASVKRGLCARDLAGLFVLCAQR